LCHLTVHRTAETARLRINGSKSVKDEFGEKSEEVIEADSDLLY
jgi:hypothetical protein